MSKLRTKAAYTQKQAPMLALMLKLAKTVLLDMLALTQEQVLALIIQQAHMIVLAMAEQQQRA
tara:strand:- start:276 stop:464 length:189 start_codon:yes stop_codon:yes gene_type:complete